MLFDAFRERLGEAWTVFHSLPWLSENERGLLEGECDFLVFHPQKGLLAVEAKTGIVAYETGAWIRERGDGARERLRKDPFRQAESSIHTLVNDQLKPALGLDGDLPIPFGYAVALPDVRSIPGRLAVHMRPELLITASDLKPLQSRVENILKTFRKRTSRGLSADQATIVLDTLLPCFKVVRNLSSQIDDQEEGLFRLTEAQWAVLESMSEQPRLLVQGCAGSGKTMLACRKAADLAASGASVLLLCFNKALGEILEANTERKGFVPTATHFHSLCARAAGAARLPFEPSEDSGKFWDDAAPQILSDALDSMEGDAWRFDAIVVDEAQDFADSWWKPIQRLLRDPNEGHLYIFYDPHQNLFARTLRFPFTRPIQKLLFNCRNTQRIAEVVQRLGNVKARPAPFCVPGTPVEEHECASDEEERDAVEGILDDLVEEQGIDCARIVLLHPHKIAHSCFAEARRLGSFEVTDHPSRHDHEVRFATVASFKGLESDCVVLCGVRSGDGKCEAEDLYVGASRAKHVLHIIHRTDEVDEDQS